MTALYRRGRWGYPCVGGTLRNVRAGTKGIARASWIQDVDVDLDLSINGRVCGT